MNSPNKALQVTAHKAAPNLNADVRRKIMKTNYNRFSISEWIGILLMVCGIALGFYGRIASTLQMSASTQKYSTFLEEAGDLTDIKSATKDVTSGLSRGQATAGLAGIGFWIFLSGIAVFNISRRQRWNRLLTENPYSAENNTEQAGAECPPQGVGFPDP